MQIKANREEFLNKLQMVQPGLSARELLQQSACYAFKDGFIMTFNGEIACRIPSKFDKKFEGAVKAKPLQELLQKMKEDVVDLEMTDSELLISGNKKKSGIRCEREVMLEIETVSKPKQWAELAEDFGDAIDLVTACASRDESKFQLVCVHIKPKFMESLDNAKAIRYKIKMPIADAALLRHDSLKNVATLGMTEMSDTPEWIHFRNPSRLVLSCRRYADSFPDLTPIFQVTGTPTVLPSGLAESVEMAEIFSKENTDDDKVLVELRPGKMRLKGEGISGWYSEVKKVKYAGKPIEFLVSPQLLIEISKKHTSCEIAPDRLKISGAGEKFVYVSQLMKAKADVPVEEEETEEGDEE